MWIAHLHIWDKTSQSSLDSIKNRACDPAREQETETVHGYIKTLSCLKLLDLIFGQLKHPAGHYNNPVRVFLSLFYKKPSCIEMKCNKW